MEKHYLEIRRQLGKYNNVQGLMRYINKETLIQKHRELDGNKATGVDKVTKSLFENLEENISKLWKK